MDGHSSRCGDFCEAAERSGLSMDDVETLARLGIHGACLLLERMRIIGVSPERLAREEPCAFRDLQKNCSMCEAREPCIRDLKRDSINPARTGWYDYCPNVAVLRMYSASAMLNQIRDVSVRE